MGNNGVLVFDLSTTIDSSGMNKFHVNIATKDEPYEARIFCQNELRANRALDSPNNEGEPLTYTVSGIPFESDVDDDNLSTTSPTTSPTSSPTDFPTFNPTELESSASPTDYPTFNPTNVESSATPSLEPTEATTTWNLRKHLPLCHQRFLPRLLRRRRQRLLPQLLRRRRQRLLPSFVKIVLKNSNGTTKEQRETANG